MNKYENLQKHLALAHRQIKTILKTELSEPEVDAYERLLTHIEGFLTNHL